MINSRTVRVKSAIATGLFLLVSVIIPYISFDTGFAATTQAETTEKSTLSERIKTYKAGIKTKIANNAQTKIALHCSVAQENTKTLTTRMKIVEKKRNAAYSNITKQLNTLLKRLDNQAYETTSLKDNITVLEGKTTDFKTSMAGYTQSLDDLSTMDCKKDPLAFIGALQAARKSHEKILPMITDIREYITNTIKPSLVQVRQQIESGNTTGGDLSQ